MSGSTFPPAQEVLSQVALAEKVPLEDLERLAYGQNVDTATSAKTSSQVKPKKQKPVKDDTSSDEDSDGDDYDGWSKSELWDIYSTIPILRATLEVFKGFDNTEAWIVQMNDFLVLCPASERSKRTMISYKLCREFRPIIEQLGKDYSWDALVSALRIKSTKGISIFHLLYWALRMDLDAPVKRIERIVALGRLSNTDELALMLSMMNIGDCQLLDQVMAQHPLDCLDAVFRWDKLVARYTASRKRRSECRGGQQKRIKRKDSRTPSQLTNHTLKCETYEEMSFQGDCQL